MRDFILYWDGFDAIILWTDVLLSLKFGKFPCRPQEVKKIEFEGLHGSKHFILFLIKIRPQGHSFLSRAVSLKQTHDFRLKREEFRDLTSTTMLSLF